MTDETYSTLRPFDALSPRGLAGKREYVLELEKKGDDGALRLLVECLADESGYLRDLAAAALVRLRAPAAPILPLLASGLWYTRTSAVRALGRLGAAEAAAPLATLLNDANHGVRHDAIEALAAIARSGKELHVARALFARPDGERAWALHDLRLKDHSVASRIDSLFRDRDLMSAPDDELLESPARVGEDGVAWDLLTGAGEPTAP